MPAPWQLAFEFFELGWPDAQKRALSPVLGPVPERALWQALSEPPAVEPLLQAAQSQQA
jgi:hypothetical protein